MGLNVKMNNYPDSEQVRPKNEILLRYYLYQAVDNQLLLHYVTMSLDVYCREGRGH